MRYGGLKILSEKKGNKSKKLYKKHSKIHHILFILNMGHTTEKEKKCPFDDYFTSVPSITLFQQMRATDQKLCLCALHKDLFTYLSKLSPINDAKAHPNMYLQKPL